MDICDVKKLPAEEREYFLNAEGKEDWVNLVFTNYKKPLSVGIGIQNQFLDNDNQTVKQWKSSIRFKKFTSLRTFKRLNKHKVYFQFVGPFPDYFYHQHEFSHEFTKCIKMFLELFFPGKSVIFIGEVNHKELDIATRIHETSQQLQLFLPDVNTYLKNNLPKDAFCVCCLSWFDFYPSKELNHVLGEGSMEQGTAAFTFGHYAMFKERELFHANNWKADYAISSPCNISDGISQDQKEGGFYDFITENEKEEAKIFTLECDQEGCAGNKLSKSPSPSHERKLSSTFRMLFKDKMSSQPASATASTNTSLTDLREVEDGQPSSNSLMSPTYDESNDSALAPNTTFDLSCKILRRLLRAMSHEICHVFGLSHCQYFSCTMNTSSSVLHTDTQPLLLCPVCLRKLQLSLNFRVKERYQKLLEFLLLHTQVCQRPGLPREEFLRMQETQVLSEKNVCLFKNDVQNILSILDVLQEKGENLGFSTLDHNETEE